MLIGVYWGYVAMIEGLIARMRAEIDKPLTIIATGGLAILFQEQAHLFDRVEPDLTLNGLMHLYNQRSPTRSEEHTSELQSLMRISYAVFCLKKKKHKQQSQQRPTYTNQYTSIN